jgi:hypothetical protein
MQSTHPGVKLTKSLGIIGRDRHQMLACQTEGGEERTLERKETDIPLPRVSR